jgi:hypothetical protein
MTMRPRCAETIERLIAAGLFKRLDGGWIAADRAPRARELPWYVRAVAQLGRHYRHVEIRAGSKPLEVQFRLR